MTAALALLAGALPPAWTMAAAQEGSPSQASAPETTGATSPATGGPRPQSQAPPGSGGSDSLDSLGLRSTSGLSPAAPSPSGRAVKPPPRRNRTVLPVRSPTRTGTTSSALAPEVRLPVTGEPDPVPSVVRPARKRLVEEDPYAQLGLRSGGIVLLPSIEQDVGYDSNPNRSALKKGSPVFRTEGGLGLKSDWPVHQLQGELRGAYNLYPDVPEADRPEGFGRMNLRLDASRDTAIDLESRFQLDTQRPGSPDLNASVRNRPLVSAFGASAAVTQRLNRLSLGLRGNVDRLVYQNARLTNGSILDQSDRDQSRYGVQLRAGYELTPGVIPFVEALADARVYDRSTDNAGFERSSTGYGARAGTTFEITRILTGEVSAGYQTRSYEDARLRDLRGPLVDVALIWVASPLTTVRLRGQSQIEETTVANASGVQVQRASLEIQHDLRRNLSVTGAVALLESDYRGAPIREEGFAGSVKVDYRVTRSLVVRASFTHERLKSTSPGSDYTANTYLVGLRFQP